MIQATRRGGAGGLVADQLDELGELVGADLELHDPAGASPDRPLGKRRAARSAAGHPGQEQVTVRIGDGEAPLRPPLLARHEISGDPGQHGSEPGDLARPLVEPEERGQADPDLDAGRCCLACSCVAGSRLCLRELVGPVVPGTVVGSLIVGGLVGAGALGP